MDGYSAALDYLAKRAAATKNEDVARWVGSGGRRRASKAKQCARTRFSLEQEQVQLLLQQRHSDSAEWRSARGRGTTDEGAGRGREGELQMKQLLSRNASLSLHEEPNPILFLSIHESIASERRRRRPIVRPRRAKHSSDDDDVGAHQLHDDDDDRP